MLKDVLFYMQVLLNLVLFIPINDNASRLNYLCDPYGILDFYLINSLLF